MIPLILSIRLEEILDQTLSDTGRQLLQQAPEDWTVARRRQLEAALLNGDAEQFESVVSEYAAVVGASKAIETTLMIWGELVEKGDQ